MPVGLPGAKVLKLVLERDCLGDRDTICMITLIERVIRCAQMCGSPLVNLGPPKDCSMMTLRPGQEVQKQGRETVADGPVWRDSHGI